MNRNGNSRVYDKGISLGSLGVALLCGSAFLLFCTFFSGLSVYKRYQELSIITDTYVLSQSDIMEMEQASDYLTEQARTFVVTENPIYLLAYTTETTVSRRRNQAIDNMYNLLGQDSVSLNLLEKAMSSSEYLSRIEIHAMKLKAMELELSKEDVPPEIWDFELSEQELAYSKEQYASTANRFIFGSEYSKEKNRVWMNLKLASRALETVISQQKEESRTVFRNSVISLVTFMLLSVVLILIFLGLMHYYILRPTKKIVQSIKNNSFMPIVGTKEFKYLEKTYNDMFEFNETSKLELEYQAMHDSLTGLFNRNAFDKMCQILKKRKEPTALIVLDVDLFKVVNDRYGHTTGDKALQCVAGLLRRFFRNEDRIVRFGGDEFLLVLSNMDQSHKDTIYKKIQEINIELQSPTDKELPPLSISAGVAFSSHGYSTELFTNADQALYRTKSNGRCGCSFCEEIL